MIPRTARARWRRRRALSFVLALLVVSCTVWALLEPPTATLVWAIVSGSVGACLLLLTYDPNPIPPREEPRARSTQER